VKTDFVVIGAGIVGLTIAHELKRREPGARVVVLEKEDRPGRHTSGRNSGVLHSGIYYPAGSLKARVCGQGAREMAEYCQSRELPLRRIGKVLVPTREADGPQLDLLAERAAANSVAVERLDSAGLARLEPEARSATGAALFVPGTAVVDPAAVMASLAREAGEAGIELFCGGSLGRVEADQRALLWSGQRLSYGHAVNAAGLHADHVAHRFGAGCRYSLLPFKGIYWKLDPASAIRVNHLVYPVPDLRVPFLGIHTTTSTGGDVYIGPTAIPAFGRESYRGMEAVTAAEFLRIATLLARQLIGGRDGFRRLAWQEGGRYSRARFAKAAQSLLPRLRPEHLVACGKVGIRAQMVDRQEGRLVADFLVEAGPASTHMLNAISPAFTSAFPLARLVCDNILELKGNHAT
jgi:L-2-hydroxyglutarate oxidase LhgO